MPTVAEVWLDNRGVRLHYIESNRDAPASLLPLVYIHGAYGIAEGFLPEMEALSPRCVKKIQSMLGWKPLSTKELFNSGKNP